MSTNKDKKEWVYKKNNAIIYSDKEITSLRYYELSNDSLFCNYSKREIYYKSGELAFEYAAVLTKDYFYIILDNINKEFFVLRTAAKHYSNSRYTFREITKSMYNRHLKINTNYNMYE